MNGSPLQRLSLFLATALLAVGCAGQPPAAQPEAGASVGSTTGDADTCAAALGNPVPEGTAELLPGTNSGLVVPRAGDGAGTAFPREGSAVVEGNATAGAPGGPAAGPTGNVGAPGMPTDGARGLSGLGVAAAREVSANGVVIGNVAVVALPSTEHMAVTPTVEEGVSEGSDVRRSAFERVHQSCVGLAEIRVVTEAADRARLAEVTAAMRKGDPVVDYLPELAEISRRASTAPGSAARQVETE